MTILLTLILAGLTTQHTASQFTFQREYTGYVESGSLHVCQPIPSGVSWEGGKATIRAAGCQVDSIYHGSFE